MDVRQLRYFRAIVEEGSLSAAANRLGVAQPSLSQHVLKLEQDLGVQLLIRTARGVTPTEAGNVLVEEGNQILEAVAAATEKVQSMGLEPRGTVAFGLPSSVSMALSVPLAETVQVELPKVRLRAVEAMSGYIRQWLDEGSIDLAMLYDVRGARDLKVTSLLVEELYLIAAPDAWPPAGKGKPGERRAVSLQEVAGLRLILPAKGHGLRDMIDRYARSHDIGLEVAVEMDALTQIKTLVARASGYTILAPAAAQDLIARGELIMIPIERPVMSRTVYLVRNPQRPVTRACLEIERLTVSVVDDLVRRGLWPGRLTPHGEQL